MFSLSSLIIVTNEKISKIMLVSCRDGLTQPVSVLEDSKTELDDIYERIEDNEDMGKIIDLNKSQISKYYENKTVLVTGATGFLGRGLVEKLLRACPIKKVLIVLRPKKNESMEERGKKIFEGAVSYIKPTNGNE